VTITVVCNIHNIILSWPLAVRNFPVSVTVSVTLH